MNSELPPHSVPDEHGVLSCILQDADAVLPDCSGLTQDSFYDPMSQAVWRAVSTLSKAGSSINSVSVSRFITQHESMDGAAAAVGLIADASPTALNLDYYLPAVLELAFKRQIIRGAGKLSEMAMNGNTAPEIITFADGLADAQLPRSAPYFTGPPAVVVLADDLERRHRLAGSLPGLDTGLNGLNRKTDGLQFGEQTLIGARPAAGKTAIGLGIFAHVVFNLKLPALFVSLEMSVAALMRRMMAWRMGIDMGTIRRGNYSDGNFQTFTAFTGQAQKAPLHILDGTGGMAIGEICATVKRYVRKNGVKLVVVDYLQKIKPEARHEKRTYEVADVSGRLRSLAVSTGAAFLTLAQLNRDSEKGNPRSPRLTDLADSAQIERDADTIVLIHRTKDGKTCQLIVAKQRDGECGIIDLHFNGPLCRFENPTMNDADVPTPRHPND